MTSTRMDKTATIGGNPKTTREKVAFKMNINVDTTAETMHTIGYIVFIIYVSFHFACLLSRQPLFFNVIIGEY